MIGYKTRLGACICGDSLDILRKLEDESVNLIVTSPPFSLQRHKKYKDSNEVAQDEYVNWLLQWGEVAYSKLAQNGSFVIDLGGAYEKGRPVRSLYQFEFLLRMCRELGYNFCQDVYWENSSALPLPIQYVNKEKIRLKSSVNMNLWFSKIDRPKANVSNVLVPYSSRMQKLISKPEDFVKEEGTVRPSGNVMGMKSWAKDNGGAIPSNVLKFANSESNSKYLRYCKALKIKAHPARYPKQLVEFWVKFLTDEGDLVVDPFSGSGTNNLVCEELGRRWLSIDLSPEYVATSAFRFANNEEDAKLFFDRIMNGEEVTLG